MVILPDPAHFFSEYIHLSGIAHLGQEQCGDPALLGKRLGLLNGSSWITAWSNYFGRLYLPGVHLVNIGNEAIQLNFMQAYADGKSYPPQINIDRFIQYAIDLVELAQVNAVMITCSTMNRSFLQVSRALEPYNTPVIQIDMPMMEKAVNIGGKVLVVATHGPTVASTQALLSETADRLGTSIEYDGLVVEQAWARLVEGDVTGHNQVLDLAIRAANPENYSCIILAQLSMSAYLFSYSDILAHFGIPVLTSGQYGFEYARDVLLNLSK